MTITRSDIPPPTTLHTTLRRITQTLASELACSAPIAPDWSEFEWLVARAVAAMHGISPLLSRTLRWQGPDGWMQFLEEQRAHTAKRHARADEFLRLIDRRAREAGIAAVALKGVALHAMGIYAAGDRPMADIDVLVRPDDAQRTARLFESLGFYELRKNWKERSFVPVAHHDNHDFGEHQANNLKIELHERICEKLPWRLTDVTELVFPATPTPGLNAYPSKASLMAHLLLHAAGSMAYQSLRFLQLHDISRLALRMHSEDWDELVASNGRIKKLWWAFPPLRLCSRYYPSDIPARVLSVLADDCPSLLARASRDKTVYDVSYSYLWVDAFPGIEWSQSFRELIDYAASRVRPSSEHVAARVHVAKSEVWAHQSQWVHLSQSRRILHWMRSRPTRPLTMHAVNAALAQTQ